MSHDALRVKFKVRMIKRRPKPAPAPVDRAERQRLDRAARRARNLALAYCIDHLIRNGEVADLAAVAHMCAVSWARVSAVASLLGTGRAKQEQLLVQISHVPGRM